MGGFCVIELVDVGMHFESPGHGHGHGHGQRRLVENMNHVMNPGELTVLFGCSGTGKSTLIKIAGGWLQPTTGEVKWDGTPVFNLSDDEKSRFRQVKIGYLSQKVSLIDRISALDNVLIPSINTPGSRGDALSHATRFLETLDLTVSARHRSSLLSDGERQKVGSAGKAELRLTVGITEPRQKTTNTTEVPAQPNRLDRHFCFMQPKTFRQ